MIQPSSDNAAGPLVSVLVPTFNRRRTLAEALASLVAQTHRRFEALIVNDGGEPVDDLVASFNDPRLILIDRRQNRGKAFSLNEALGRARGTYVAYLDDDDLFYPGHLARLVRELEADAECGAAYSDLYKVHCRVRPDGSRQVLGKVVNVSRDFDRAFLCHFNHVLHVSLMHRRDLLEKTGLYNEGLRVLIDWDMTRRLAFFTDFRHVSEVTGEYYGPVGPCDRISYRQRLDPSQYLRQVAAIRTTRPRKPWPKMPDLSIIFLPESIDEAAGQTLRDIWLTNFMPYELYLPLPSAQLQLLQTSMPNLVRIPVPAGASREARLDASLPFVAGDCVAVVPPGTPVAEMWIENPLHAARQQPAGGTAFFIHGAARDWPAVVLSRDDCIRARRGRAGTSWPASLAEAGIVVREPDAGELPFQFDFLLQEAQAMEADGNWVRAARLYQQTGVHFANKRWMGEQAARALYAAGGRDAEALRLCQEASGGQATPATLLLEGRIRKRANDFATAAELLERADRILVGTP
jgi:hypothetical protein